MNTHPTTAVLALLALTLASACSPSAKVAVCPVDPEHSVLVVLPESFPEPSETARVAAALDAALAGSKATNTAVTLIKGRSGTVIAGGCGFADDERLTEQRIRRAVSVTPIMSGFVAAYSQSGDDRALDLLDAARTLARYAGNAEGTTVSAVIMAPRLRDFADDVAVSFQGGRYPSDGMLAAPPTQSTLSVVGRTERLAGINLYLAAPEEDWDSARHTEAVNRFWFWWAVRQGATVRTMSGGLEAALLLALANEGRVGDAYAPAPDEEAKPEMLTVNPVVVPEPFALSAADFRTAPQFRAPAKSFRGALSIGVVWNDPGADIDLRTAATREGPELYYGRTRVAGVGSFEKRTEDGRTGARGFEFVKFTGDVDIREATVFVNLYEMLDADAPPHAVSGELRVTFEGGYYSMPFEFLPLRQGDLGDGHESFAARRASPYWREIKLQDLIPHAAG